MISEGLASRSSRHELSITILEDANEDEDDTDAARNRCY